MRIEAGFGKPRGTAVTDLLIRFLWPDRLTANVAAESGVGRRGWRIYRGGGTMNEALGQGEVEGRNVCRNGPISGMRLAKIVEQGYRISPGTVNILKAMVGLGGEKRK